MADRELVKLRRTAEFQERAFRAAKSAPPRKCAPPPNQNRPAPNALPEWWAGFVDGERVTAWDRRRDRVAYRLTRYLRRVVIEDGRKELRSCRSHARPTWRREVATEVTIATGTEGDTTNG